MTTEPTVAMLPEHRPGIQPNTIFYALVILLAATVTGAVLLDKIN